MLGSISDKITLKIDRKKNVVIINGEEYPPAYNNACVWKEYLRTKGTKTLLTKLSKVSLDI